MRLVDLKPRWVAAYEAGGARRSKAGVEFDCPHCVAAGKAASEAIHVLFDVPVDGGGPLLDRPDSRKWKRTGETFDTLTLAPSIDCSGWGCWHGFITAGEVRTC